MRNFDCRLYVIIDVNFHPWGVPQAQHHSRGVWLERIVTVSIRGGATMIQLRDKQSSTKQFIALANKLHALTGQAKIPFIVNDRVDIAAAVDAQGVHLGQEDMPIPIARKLLGKGKIIGASVKTVALAKKVQRDGADYLGVGPVFKTQSKRDGGEPLGIKRLSLITKAVTIPVVAIGGITGQNAASVIRAGASGIAVISAVMGAEDPEEATRKLRLIVDDRRWSIEDSILNIENRG